MGAIAAVSLQGVSSPSAQFAALRPVYTLFPVAAMALGLTLMWQGEGVQRIVRAQCAPAHRRIVNILPCDLLYSASLVAALTSSALGGVALMALFALASSVALVTGPWLLPRLRSDGLGRWGVRVAGMALAAISGWAR